MKPIRTILAKLNIIAAEAPIAHNFPQSRKHIRVTTWSNRITVTYYGHNGRKVTKRSYPLPSYGHVIASARAKGYRAI